MKSQGASNDSLQTSYAVSHCWHQKISSPALFLDFNFFLSITSPQKNHCLPLFLCTLSILQLFLCRGLAMLVLGLTMKKHTRVNTRGLFSQQCFLTMNMGLATFFWGASNVKMAFFSSILLFSKFPHIALQSVLI